MTSDPSEYTPVQRARAESWQAMLADAKRRVDRSLLGTTSLRAVEARESVPAARRKPVRIRQKVAA